MCVLLLLLKCVSMSTLALFHLHLENGVIYSKRSETELRMLFFLHSPTTRFTFTPPNEFFSPLIRFSLLLSLNDYKLNHCTIFIDSSTFLLLFVLNLKIHFLVILVSLFTVSSIIQLSCTAEKHGIFVIVWPLL